MVKITIKKFKECVKDSRGNLTLIANRLNVARSTVYDYIKKEGNEWAKQLIEDEAWKPYDIVHGKVQQIAIQKEEGWAIRTMLLEHKKGRELGYGREQNINIGGTDKPVKLQLEIIDKVDNEDNQDEGKSSDESIKEE